MSTQDKTSSLPNKLLDLRLNNFEVFFLDLRNFHLTNEERGRILQFIHLLNDALEANPAHLLKNQSRCFNMIQPCLVMDPKIEQYFLITKAKILFTQAKFDPTEAKLERANEALDRCFVHAYFHKLDKWSILRLNIHRVVIKLAIYHFTACKENEALQEKAQQIRRSFNDDETHHRLQTQLEEFGIHTKIAEAA